MDGMDGMNGYESCCSAQNVFLQSTPFWEEHGRTELRMLSVLIRDF